MYLPDDILTKLDRCTMECGLEGREPLLDQRIFELSWRIPAAWRTDGTVGKVLLREVLARHLPPQARAVLARPKAGFGVPLRTWLCGPLRDWCEDVLEPRRLNAQGVLDPAPLRQAWDRCRAGDESAAARTWAACVVSRWLEREGLDASRVARA
jgi:asparagine synthase (glutamine-hydrolysing)